MSDKVINLNIGVSTRQKFSIDDDENRIIELDTKDVGIADRFARAIKRMESLEEKWVKLRQSAELAEKAAASIQENIDNINAEDFDTISQFSDSYREVDREMRDILDEIFDCPGMCDTILGNTCTFSIVNGHYKYEQIMDVLIGVYEAEIKSEVGKLNRARIADKTQKYTRKK